MEFDELSRSVIGRAIEVHRNLGPGLLESIYRQCWACELSQAGIPFQMEVPLPVRYKDILLDCGCRIDLLVGDDLNVEIKRNTSPNPSRANSYVHAPGETSTWTAYQFQCPETAKRHQAFRSVILRALRVLRGVKRRHD